MKNKTIILLFIMGVFCPPALGYNKNIHNTATGESINSSSFIDYLTNKLGLTSRTEFSDGLFERKTAMAWIKSGGTREDDFPRFLTHFYDPTTGNGLYFLIQQTSSKDWAKNISGNQWNWVLALDNFYTALTSTNAYIRETRLAATFRGMGQIMHLVEDLTAPAHVRNDPHIPVSRDKDFYEAFTDKNFNPAKGIISYTGYPVVDLSTFSNFDSFWKNGGKGLAEFTNQNFLSRNTNLDDNKYSLPVAIGEWIAQETPVPGKPSVDVKYIQGYVTDPYRPEKSAPINRLAAVSYFDFEMKKLNPGKSVYTLNDAVHREYANFLVPRAVGYTAGMLNYFFRGSIELSLPAQGVYGLAAPGSSGYREIRVKARNSTANEAMTGGTVLLVVKYKLAQSDPFLSVPVDAGPEQYIVAPEKTGIASLASSTATELAFDISATPLPLWAVDVYFQVVYRGQLGSEADAVAVGFKDISEPTPIDIVNNMDVVCVNDNLLAAGSPAAVTAVDTNDNGYADWDVYPHNLINVYLAFNGANASAANHRASFASIPAGSYGRVFVLGDYSVSSSALQVSAAVTMQRLNVLDVWELAFGVGVDAIDAINNQTYYPEMYLVRGAKSWWYTYYHNPEYPSGSTCDFSVAQPDLVGPVGGSIQ